MYEMISVKDRLPSEDGIYLVYTDGAFGFCRFSTVTRKFIKPLPKVTHWLPLISPSPSDDPTDGIDYDHIRKIGKIMDSLDAE